MNNSDDFEARLAILERKVEELTRNNGGGDARPHWLDQVVGSFADLAEFDEVVRLGREFRESYDSDATAQ
jgi:hypothetical protein